MRVIFEDYPREIFDAMMSDDILVVYAVRDEHIIFYDPMHEKIKAHSFKHPSWYRYDDRWVEPSLWQKMICKRLWHELVVAKAKERSNESK